MNKMLAFLLAAHLLVAAASAAPTSRKLLRVSTEGGGPDSLQHSHQQTRLRSIGMSDEPMASFKSFELDAAHAYADHAASLPPHSLPVMKAGARKLASQQAATAWPPSGGWGPQPRQIAADAFADVDGANKEAAMQTRGRKLASQQAGYVWPGSRNWGPQPRQIAADAFAEVDGANREQINMQTGARKLASQQAGYAWPVGRNWGPQPRQIAADAFAEVDGANKQAVNSGARKLRSVQQLMHGVHAKPCEHAKPYFTSKTCTRSVVLQ